MWPYRHTGMEHYDESVSQNESLLFNAMEIMHAINNLTNTALFNMT